MIRKRVEPWATQAIHDGPMEHWRVTALLAKTAFRVWETLTQLSSEERDNLPESVQKLIPIVYRQIELTDYFLSGMVEGERTDK